MVSLNPSDPWAPHLHYPDTCPRALDLSLPSHQDLNPTLQFSRNIPSICIRYLHLLWGVDDDQIHAICWAKAEEREGQNSVSHQSIVWHHFFSVTVWSTEDGITERLRVITPSFPSILCRQTTGVSRFYSQ